MSNAFGEGFNNGYQSICIIGSDCFELNSKIILQAFETLTKNDVVMGPAKDGGYYLLGMNRLHREVFKNKTWSTDSVSTETISDFKELGLTYDLLDVLSDVDEEKDLPLNFW